VYVTATQALNLYMGCAPAGPAGTGKTESTKVSAREKWKYSIISPNSPPPTHHPAGSVLRPRQADLRHQLLPRDGLPGPRKHLPRRRLLRCLGVLRRVQPPHPRGAVRVHRPVQVRVRRHRRRLDPRARRGRRGVPGPHVRCVHHHEPRLPGPLRAP
jgi:hypothetical protein